MTHALSDGDERPYRAVSLSDRMHRSAATLEEACAELLEMYRELADADRPASARTVRQMLRSIEDEGFVVARYEKGFWVIRKVEEMAPARFSEKVLKVLRAL